MLSNMYMEKETGQDRCHTSILLFCILGILIELANMFRVWVTGEVGFMRRFCYNTAAMFWYMLCAGFDVPFTHALSTYS